jgi:tetratricopeptide (TPR) repeat protein
MAHGSIQPVPEGSIAAQGFAGQSFQGANGINATGMSAAGAVGKGVVQLTLDDLDPKQNSLTARLANRASGWSSLRLAILLAILIPLAVFGYFQNRQTTSMNRIQKALSMWDDRSAISELKQVEQRSGLSAQTAFLRARAYRHLGDDIAFAQFSAIAKQLGYSEEKLKAERMLRETHLGVVPDIDRATAELMALPDGELEEIGPSVIYGLLGKLQFETVEMFLQFWIKQDPKTPWVDFFRGMLALSGRDAKAATELLENCAKNHPGFVPVYRQLASAYLLSRDNERAVIALKRFLKSNPDDLDAQSAMVTALFNQDLGDEVIAFVEPLIESGKATIEMKTNLARAYAAKEQYKKVVDVLSGVAALWPEDVRIANQLSQAHQALGGDAEADRFAKIADAGQADLQSVDGRLARLMSGTDKQAQQHYELGHILLHKQSRDDGVHWLNSALSIDESFLPAHEDMVVYFTRINRPDLAARHQRYINLRRGVQ